MIELKADRIELTTPTGVCNIFPCLQYFIGGVDNVSKRK